MVCAILTLLLTLRHAAASDNHIYTFDIYFSLNDFSLILLNAHVRLFTGRLLAEKVAKVVNFVKIPIKVAKKLKNEFN